MSDATSPPPFPHFGKPMETPAAGNPYAAADAGSASTAYGAPPPYQPVPPQPFYLEPTPSAVPAPPVAAAPYGAYAGGAVPYGAPGAGYGPAAPYGIDPMTGLPYSEKSKLVAGLLQIFLAPLGIGRFYMGNVGVGIAQIILTFVTLGLGSLWAFIDGIVILAGSPRDVHGRPLRP